MQRTELSSSAAVPYQRETFVEKKIVLDYDGDFNMTDATSLSNNARGKGLHEIYNDIDSLNELNDSIGRAFYTQSKMFYYRTPVLNRTDSITQTHMALRKDFNIDTVFAHLSADKQRAAVQSALSTVQSETNDLEFKAMVTKDANKIVRQHKIEAINKFTLALSCLIFFFIGAPLGAIIRKGGLGVPVIISVLVYIIYYILDNSGYRMARGGMWAIWFGKSLASAVLIPLAAFVTYKANNDSVVFNIDLYRNFFMKLLGLRLKRHVYGKEVIITPPDYPSDRKTLNVINDEVSHYSHRHRLYTAPNIIKVFFKYHPDHAIERINSQLEKTINDLSNTRDPIILSTLNLYPIIAVKAHTRPFERRWLNIVSAIIFPIGAVLYFRMWMFRLRLYKDLRTIQQTSEKIITRIDQIHTT